MIPNVDPEGPRQLKRGGEYIVKSDGLGADHYLQKPVEPDEFLDFAQSVEKYRLSIVQQPQ